MNQRTQLVSAAAFAVLVAGAVAALAARQTAGPESRVDAIMGRWNKTTPGCAVGVGVNNASVLERAYGLADLEHETPNTPNTIFEAGSVSKQFTAAAILLLARDGKLSLDDTARKYVPELPDYGAPLTIRHMLNHTSGLRDWGAVAAISGWPRGARVHTHAHVLDIVSRQRSLNFPTGTRWSYSNTGYNLSAIIVARVSGQSFADFTRDRIFTPLGMTRTSWRDDYTRIVKGRAIAYDEGGGNRFTLDMPFENVHGNGGLLTTVGDLLRWSRNFASPTVGDASLLQHAQQPGQFTDGRAHNYALGLQIGTYRGVREVSHSGATAGYRAYLASYPDRKLTVAVLCNAGSADATRFAHHVADIYLNAHPPTTANGAANGSTAAAADTQPSPFAGIYRNMGVGGPLTLTAGSGSLAIENGGALTRRSATQYAAANGRSYDFASDGRLIVTDQFGRIDTYARVGSTDITPKPLADYAATYVSDEAEVTMTAAVEGGTLVLKRRPDSVIRLTPVYADAFRAPIGFVKFQRDGAGRVTGFSINQDRVWDLRFSRQ
jgi:CubicO group peptidase (beta-lactamase class C family)